MQKPGRANLEGDKELHRASRCVNLNYKASVTKRPTGPMAETIKQTSKIKRQAYPAAVLTTAFMTNATKRAYPSALQRNGNAKDPHSDTIYIGVHSGVRLYMIFLKAGVGAQCFVCYLHKCFWKGEITHMLFKEVCEGRKNAYAIYKSLCGNEQHSYSMHISFWRRKFSHAI